MYGDLVFGGPRERLAALRTTYRIAMERDWMQVRPNTVLGWILRIPLRMMPHGTIVKVRTGINQGMKWIVGSSLHSCWLGTYELEKQRTLTRFVKPGSTVFDIGANAGFYTLAFSRLVGEQGRVWSFEPLAENANNILRHIKLNGLRNVVLLQAATTDRTGIVGFRTSEANTSGAISQEELYKVPAVSLDYLVENQICAMPDLIKMDVEGAESSVLEGCKLILSGKTTIIFIALHGDEQKIRCRKILESFGYEIMLFDGTTLGNKPLWDDEIYAVPTACREDSDPPRPSAHRPLSLRPAQSSDCS